MEAVAKIRLAAGVVVILALGFASPDRRCRCSTLVSDPPHWSDDGH